MTTVNQVLPETAAGSLVLRTISVLVALTLIGYSSVTVWYSITGAMEHYTIHVSLVFLLVTADIAVGLSKRKPSRRNYILLALVGLLSIAIALSGIYFVIEAKTLEFSQPFISNVDFAFGCLLVVAVLTVTLLVWGWPLMLICLLAALYFAFGYMLPEVIATNRKYDPSLIVSYLSGMGGPRGILTYVPLSADVIFLLLVFGGALHGTRVIDMFSEIGKAIGNLFRGGVAYSAVTASLLIGMVTGQSVSNIALSGSMTIPTMIRSGFTKDEAGAIEVLASTGSQLLPPIMGLGAFLMAVILGISYIEVAIAAIIPAFMYLFAVTAAITCLIGASENIPFKKQEVDWRLVRWTAPSFIVSFTVLIVLLSLRFSPSMAGFWGTLLAVVLSTMRPKDLRPSFTNVFDGLHEGALAGVKLAVILTAIGIIVQMLVTTGAGLNLGRLMIEASSGNLAIGLILGMGVALLIGMGLPTPAAYALIAIVVVPSLIDLGLTPMVANFYGFYFAIFSTLTPPVAVGVLTALRISNGTFMGTTIESIKMGGICFLVPFLFVAFPSVLEFPNVSWNALAMLVSFGVATWLLSVVVYGALPTRRISKFERMVLAIIGPVVFTLTLFMDGALYKFASPALFLIWAFINMKMPKSYHSLCLKPDKV
jgi:TRAP transporter 4TM/12TM fusion protein